MKQGAGLALAAILALTGCRGAVDAFRPAVNWDFVQATGGMRVGKPYVDDGLLFIPVTVDFSGNRTLSVAPTLSNTGLQCMRGQADLRTSPFLPIAFDYDIDVSFQSVADAAARPAIPGAPHPCDELIVPLRFGPFIPVRAIPPEPKTIKLWYRDSAFARHYIGEYTL